MGAEDGSTESSTAETIVTTAELKEFYQIMGGQTATAADAVRILDTILNRDSEEDLTISEIKASIIALRDLINVNTKEIFYLNTLIAKLIFTLLDQGIEINNKELLNELKQFYGYTR